MTPDLKPHVPLVTYVGQSLWGMMDHGEWFVVLFIVACSAGTFSVAKTSSAPFIDVVNTDGVAADLFAMDFKADPSCSGLTLHIQPQGKPTRDGRATFWVTFYKDSGWFLAGQSYAGFAGGFAGSLGVERHHAVHMTCTIAKASVHAVLVK